MDSPPYSKVAELDQKDFLVIELDGRRTGPHSIDKLRQMFLDGQIDANCKVHIKKLFGWKMISEVFDLSLWGYVAPPIVEQPVTPPPVAEEPAIETEQTQEPFPEEENLPEKEEEEALPKQVEKSSSAAKSGMSRSAFCSAIIGGIVFIFVLFDTSLASSVPLFKPIVLGLYFAALIPLSAQRLLNIGENPNWCLTMFVPLMNILTLGKCLSCQESYAETGILDSAGRIIFGIFVLIVAVLLIGGLIVTVGQRFL